MSLANVGRILLSTALCSSIAISSPAMAQAITNFEAVFVVDESGSMGGEQTFLSTFVPAFDAQLAALGITGSYGLVGFGSSSIDPRPFAVGGTPFGTASDFATAVGGLTTSGSTEDGYDGVDFALNNFGFSTAATTQRLIILVSDEDRDIYDATVSLASLQTLLAQNGVTLSGILSQDITDQAGTVAIGASSTQTFIDANNDGVAEASTTPIIGSGAGTTTDDYTNPILQGGGCVANLDLLRLGGTAASAFATALRECLAQIIVNPPPGAVGNEPFLQAIANNSVAIPQKHYDDVSMRLTGRLNGLETIVAASGQSATGAAGQSANGLMVLGGSNGETSINAASATGEMGAFKFFVNAGGDWTKADSVGSQPDYKQTAGHLTAGVDMDVGESGLLGLAFGYTSASADADNDVAEMNQTMLSVTAYGAARIGEAGWLNGALMLAHNDYALDRNTAGGTFTADTDGMLFSANLEGGTDIRLGSGNFVMSPSAGLRYVNLSVDGYTEDQAGGQTVDDQSYNSLTASAKVKLAAFIEAEKGTFVPELTLGASYDIDAFGDGVAFAVGAGAPVIANIDNPNRFTFSASPGIGFVTEDGRTAFRLDYTATINDDYVNHAVAGRIRYHF